MKTKIVFMIDFILSIFLFNFNSALAKRGNNLEADSIYVAGQMLLKFNSQGQLNKGLITTPYLDSLNQIFSVQAFGPFYYMDSNTDMALFQELGQDRIYLYIFPDTLDMFYVSGQYKLSPNVNWSEPNYIFRLDYTPPDEYFNLQWGLHNTGQAPFYGTPGADIDASKAWDINDNIMPPMKIAIIDTGIDTLNYDVYTQIWHNPLEDYDGVNDDGNYILVPQYPEDTCYLVDDVWGWNFDGIAISTSCGDNSPRPTHAYLVGAYYGSHGTSVSGVAGASAYTEKPIQPETDSPNFIGIVGVNWNSKLMSLKACSDYGSCPATSDGLALQYAADKGTDVINMSFGLDSSSNYLRTCIEYAFRRGCVLVASMGNCYPNCNYIRYPASYDSFVIAVGATNSQDNRRANSSYGEHIDVVAPGNL
jgi:thermitase